MAATKHILIYADGQVIETHMEGIRADAPCVYLGSVQRSVRPFIGHKWHDGANSVFVHAEEGAPQALISKTACNKLRELGGQSGRHW